VPFFRQRFITTQVGGAMGLLALLTILGSLSLLLLARRASQNATEVYRDRLLPIQQLMVVSEAYTVDITFALRAVRTGQMQPEAGLEALRRGEGRALAAWGRYKAQRVGSPGVQAVDACLLRLRGLTVELAPLLATGATPALGTFGDAIWLPEAVTLSRQLQDLREEEEHQAQALIQALESRSRQILVVGLTMMVAVLLLTLGFGQAFSAHLRKGVGSMVGYLQRVADGSLEAIPVEVGEGELVMAEQELNRTITRLNQLVVDLQGQKARYQLLAERLPDVVYQAQVWPDGRRTWPFVSPQFEAFYGVGPEVMEQDADYSLRKVHPDDMEGYLYSLAEAARRMGPMEWEGRSFTERPGELKWVRVRRSPTPQPDGSVLWDGVLEDITRLKQSEEALRLSEARAQQASRAKSAFLASMSHELRTPLSAIIGYSRLMSRDAGRSEEDLLQLEQVLKAGEHLLSLINDVLSLSKIEAGRMELKVAPFSPADLVRELEALFRLSALTKGLAFEVELQGLPLLLEGDQAKLRQVLVNLLGNALKFTPRGQVRLIASWRHGLGLFRVEDTGPGVSLEEQAQIFAAFHQTALGHASGGTGLGLHISQALVTLLGGALQIDNRPEGGSVFRFEVPLPEPEGPVVLPDKGQVVRLVEGQAPRKLLIVDDRRENRDILDRLLSLVGFHCSLAEHGAAGLEQWREQQPDLILMDLRMPVMDGFEAVALLRAAEAAEGRHRTPVLAVSASVYDVSTEDLLQRGFDAFLTKPINEDHLFACLEELLGVRFERKLLPGRESPGARRLEALADQPAEWRARFLDQVASGDLEAAESLLGELLDTTLADAVRSALRAYHVEDILKPLR